MGAMSIGAMVYAWPVSVSELPSTSKLVAPDLVRDAAWVPGGYETVALNAMSAKIVIVGDIMLDRNVAARMQVAKDPAYAFRKLPDLPSRQAGGWFNSFDYAVANLEGPVTDKDRAPEKTIDFRFDPSVLSVLKDQGLDAFSQANNHALDQGQIGFDDSQKRLRESGFLAFGHQVKDDEVSLATTTINGVRLAFLGFNVTDNALDRATASRVLSEARDQSDRVIVMVHWGTEYRDRPDAKVIEMGHWFIDQGADAVIGGHPHWYQGISSYKNKPIAWSLGNFVFDQDFSDQTRQGLAVALTFNNTSSVTLEPLPIQIDSSQPRLATGDELQRRLEKLAMLSDPELKEQILAGKINF